MTDVVYKADDTNSVRSIWSCYWLDQILTLEYITRISSKFSMFHWICLQFILLVLVGVELPLCQVVALSYNAVTCSLESG